MAASQVAPAPAASPKTTKKATKTKPAGKSGAPASHPTYGDMVKKAIAALNEKKGSSRAAILKYIATNYKVGDNLTKANAHLRTALKRGVTSGAFKQTSGTGSNGSFKLAESKAAAPKKAKTTKAKAAKPSPKKAAPKKTIASPKKAAAKPKKAATKATKAKPTTPKKAASPKKKAAAKPKVAKKTASPKKTKSPKAKQPATKRSKKVAAK